MPRDTLPTPAGDLTKLPKWAQRYTDVLLMRLREAQERLAEGTDDASVFMNPYSTPPTPLGHDPTIEFRIEDGRNEYIQVQRDAYEENSLRVHSSRGLLVRPVASNVVKIKWEER